MIFVTNSFNFIIGLKDDVISLLKICKYQQSQIKRLNKINDILMDVNHDSIKLIKGGVYND